MQLIEVHVVPSTDAVDGHIPIGILGDGTGQHTRQRMALCANRCFLSRLVGDGWINLTPRFPCRQIEMPPKDFRGILRIIDLIDLASIAQDL